MKTAPLIIFLVLILNLHAYTQSDSSAVAADSTSKAKEKRKQIYSSPRRASLLSAAFPGLGQAYNKKYWKLPVIYIGIGALSYIFYVNNSEYNEYRKALKYSLDNGGVGTVAGISYSTENLQLLKLGYKKSRDFAAIGIGIIYLLNIIDANVDAHLKTFDVSDDLSLLIKPWPLLNTDGGATTLAGGLTLKLNFKK